MNISQRLKYFWLSSCGLTAQKQNKLLEHYDIDTLYDSISNQKFNYNQEQKTLMALSRYKDPDYLERKLAHYEQQGVKILTYADEQYPESLKQRETSPPLVLYYKGDLSLLNGFCIAVVGTRFCDNYGKYVSELFCKELAQNDITIVSGLASGVDAYAHKAALDGGGKTIAVLGSGHLNVTPVTNIGIYNKIISQGLVISEYPPEFVATKYSFPERNRIISGLSKGVLVVQAPIKSGALITANYALEQSRDVFAVPGNIDFKRSQGCNNLIKQGAILASSPLDILDFYKISHNTHQKTEHLLDNFTQKVYNCLKLNAVHFDNMLTELNCSASQLSGALTQLELLSLVRKTASNTYTLI